MTKARTVPRVRACEFCTELFESIGRGGVKKYCSDECSRRASRRRWNANRQSHWQPKTCEWCFREWQPKSKMTQKFCSTKCGNAYHHQLERFGVTDYSIIPICSCGNLACPDPWKTLGRKKRGKHRRCLDCRKAQRARFDAGRGSHKAKRRREIVKAGEAIKFDDLLMRDGPLCQICGELMDWQTGRHRQRVSLDHIIPISKGGLHTMDNVRLVHLSCNSRKSDKVPAHVLCLDQ